MALASSKQLALELAWALGLAPGSVVDVVHLRAQPLALELALRLLRALDGRIRPLVRRDNAQRPVPALCMMCLRVG